MPAIADAIVAFPSATTVDFTQSTRLRERNEKLQNGSAMMKAAFGWVIFSFANVAVCLSLLPKQRFSVERRQTFHKGPTMKNIFRMTASAAAMLVLGVARLHAQGFGGCADSPENPTLVLAGLASGAFAVSQLRMRMRARRKDQQ